MIRPSVSSSSSDSDQENRHPTFKLQSVRMRKSCKVSTRHQRASSVCSQLSAHVSGQEHVSTSPRKHGVDTLASQDLDMFNKVCPEFSLKALTGGILDNNRSEERRVGKECRCRW